MKTMVVDKPKMSLDQLARMLPRRLRHYVLTVETSGGLWHTSHILARTPAEAEELAGWWVVDNIDDTDSVEGVVLSSKW